MHVRKRRSTAVVVLMLVFGALALSASSLGGTDNTRLGDAHAAKVAGGFGEIYKANPKTLAKTLFKATLLPSNTMAKNVALAAYRRADMKVNQNLALKCWKNNGCSTGTGGKLTVAYVEGFGENVYRQVSKMEFILQALTYPQIGHIIYSSAHSDLNQALADFRAVIAKHVSAIVTYPDFGDAMIPVFKEATKAGIPVSTYAWGYVSGPGTNYTTVVGEDTCKLGKAFAQVMNTQVKSGDIAFLGGFPGNPLSLGWQKCEQPALNPNIHVVANEPTNWDPSKVQGIVAGILAQHPDIKGWSYEDAEFMAEGGYAAYKAAGLPYNTVLTMRTDETALGCLYNKLNNPNLKVYYYTAGNSQIRVALTADMMKLKGAKIPPTIVFPIQLQNMATRNTCVAGYPPSGSATSLVPVGLLHRMYP
jgi:ABC-type sugar transport system substrate-binding protein